MIDLGGKLGAQGKCDDRADRNGYWDKFSGFPAPQVNSATPVSYGLADRRCDFATRFIKHTVQLSSPNLQGRSNIGTSHLSQDAAAFRNSLSTES